MVIIDPCKSTTITAPPQVDHSYSLLASTGDLDLSYIFQVSPSYCPITFDTQLAPVTTTLVNAITASSGSRAVSYKVNSTDYLLEGVYPLTVISYDRWGVANPAVTLSELTILNPCKTATISLANKYFLQPPAISHTYTLSNKEE